MARQTREGDTETCIIQKITIFHKFILQKSEVPDSPNQNFPFFKFSFEINDDDPF